MTNVLVVGAGGREHALAWKLRQSAQVRKVFTVPENATEFSCSEIKNLNDVEIVKLFCKKNQIKLVIIGPEKQICEGWKEELESVSEVFAPSVASSIIESSKSFAKNFMKRHEIPTAGFEVFTDAKSAEDYIVESGSSKFVIKEDGLRAGKGVFVCESLETAKTKISKLSISADCPVVIEEFLEGFEISALCFTDGTTIKLMPFSQDHKRALEGDRGDNTGGMGAVAPIYLPQNLEKEIQEILQKTIDGLKAEGKEYRGVLYAGLMITQNGPKVLEYNCRFGDPETQVLMRLLDSDLYLISEACCLGTLSTVSVNWTKKFIIGVVIASKGYPGEFEKDKKITNIPKDDDEIVTFYAGVKKDVSGDLVNSGGRVLCVTCAGKSFYEAREKVYKAVRGVGFQLAGFRSDIGNFVLTKRKPFSYQASGVNISEGNALVQKIKTACKNTLTPGTDEIGGFGALVDLKQAGFEDPLLVLGMDGVGTKLEIASFLNNFDSLGFDLVGMCVNDVVCHGAAPVAFLDYYVTGKLNKEVAAKIITSISEACKDCGCALVGGETAEMPGVYRPGQWDLAGCCVGVRERAWGEFPKMKDMSEGDIIIGLYSSGLHSNGFSLVRALFEKNGIKYTDKCPWDKNLTFGDELLKPTKLYPSKVLPLIKRHMIKGTAHITGGGLVENVPRILPEDLAARIDCSSWRIPEIFKFLQKLGNVHPLEMFRTFNCGIGMVTVVDENLAKQIFQKLSTVERISVIGKIEKRKDRSDQVILENTDSIVNCDSGSVLNTKRANVAVLISGTGSNAINLIEQAANPLSNCNIRVVISNKEDAKGLEAARERGIEAICIPHGSDRQLFEEKIHQELLSRNVDFICLAGFMRILTPYLLDKWPNKIINIHPSLLPAFKGAHAVRDALRAGVKVTGCTAHFVCEEVDAGKILSQETQLGILEGFTYNNSDGSSSDVFLGVRYAKAPVGDLRFEKPMPYREWEGVYEAKTFPKSCIPIHPSFFPEEEVSEDCLFLNIIRPSGKPKDPQGFPILVFIHGGGFCYGNTARYGYKSLSENFARHGIIVVTIQYRMGVFGFFSTGDKVLPGNIGLWDQMYALFFLHQFLPNFHGNPFKTTVMGHSAGAASVHALAMSPHSVDLFQRAIQLSGSLFAEWAMNDHVIENSNNLADAVGCDSSQGSVKVHDCMKTKTVAEIYAGVEKLGVYKQHVRLHLFAPRFDGEFLLQSTELLMKGAPEIPTVFGITKVESSRIVNEEFDPVKNPLGIPSEIKEKFDARELQIYIADHVVEYDETGRAGGGFRIALYEQFVDKDAPQNPEPSFYLHRASELVDDLVFKVPIVQQLEIRNSLNHKSYLFYQKHARKEKNSKIIEGAKHGNELYYIFDRDFPQDFELDEADRIFQNNLLEMIRNFTINEVPKSSGIDWPHTSRGTKHVVLNPGPTVEDNFEPEKMQFWLRDLPRKVGVQMLQRTRLPHAELHQKHTEL